MNLNDLSLYADMLKKYLKLNPQSSLSLLYTTKYYNKRKGIFNIPYVFSTIVGMIEML